MVSVEGENMRPVTWCVIQEAASGDWAIGGQCLTTEAVQALAAGKGSAGIGEDNGANPACKKGLRPLFCARRAPGARPQSPR